MSAPRAPSPSTFRGCVSSPGTAPQFYNIDSVVFDDSGTVHNVVYMVGNVEPREVNVNVSAGRSCTFHGSGSIVGAT